MEALTLHSGEFVVAVVAFLISALVVGCFRQKIRVHQHARFPPCLPWLSVIGATLFVEKDANQVPRFLMDQAKRYGNVFVLNMGSRYAVVLNGYSAIKQALLNKSTAFADRFPAFGRFLLTDTQIGKGIITASYNSSFRRKHQLYLSILKEFGFGQRLMETRINAEVAELVGQIKLKKGQPFNLKDLIYMCVLNVTIGILIGQRYPYGHQNLKIVSDSIQQLFEESLQGLLLFPMLKYTPIFRSRIRRARAATQRLMEVAGMQIDYVLENYEEKADEQTDGLIKRVIESNSNGRQLTSLSNAEFDREDLAVTVFDFTMAGRDTTAVTLLWAIKLLAENPNVQSRLQAEVDAVVERDRQPSLDDESRMPYTQAVILETLRLHSPLPLSLFRATTCDTVLGDYFIPAKTVVIPNLFSAHMDPAEWNDPTSFKPERFLDGTGQLELKQKQRMISFSLGKRSCIGEPLARQELFLFLTGIVQSFDIRPPDDHQEIVSGERSGFLIRPTEYTMRLISRDDTVI